MARIDRPVLMQGYQTWDKGSSFNEFTLYRHYRYQRYCYQHCRYYHRRHHRLYHHHYYLLCRNFFGEA